MNVYVPQKGDILTPNALVSGAISQFQGFWAACGEAAASVVYAIQHGTRASAGVLDSFVVGLHAQGLASAQGTTSLRGIATALTQTGVQSTVIDNWRQAIAQFTGTKPVVLLFQNAQALPGETPGLRGHFGTVVGYQPATNKFVVEDGNSRAARSGLFSLYSASQLAAAQPVGAVVPTGSGPTPAPPGADGTRPTQQQIIDWLKAHGIDPNSFQGQWLQAIAQNGDPTPQSPGDYVSYAWNHLQQAPGQVLGAAGSAVGSTLGPAIAAGLTTVGDTFLHAIGVNSTKDLAFRLVLIVGGLIVTIAGIRAITATPMQQASQAAQSVAPAVAAAG